jgi:hypothetical protein
MIAHAEFAITRWEQEEPFDAPSSGPPQARTFVDKSFSGDVTGTSQAVLITCQVSNEQAGYVASERVTVAIGDAFGTFVIQHGGIVDGESIEQFGNIVPGSGTGDLAGIRGTGVFRHDAEGARLTLVYELD